MLSAAQGAPRRGQRHGVAAGTSRTSARRRTSTCSSSASWIAGGQSHEGRTPWPLSSTDDGFPVRSTYRRSSCAIEAEPFLPCSRASVCRFSLATATWTRPSAPAASGSRRRPGRSPLPAQLWRRMERWSSSDRAISRERDRFIGEESCRRAPDRSVPTTWPARRTCIPAGSRSTTPAGCSSPAGSPSVPRARPWRFCASTTRPARSIRLSTATATRPTRPESPVAVWRAFLASSRCAGSRVWASATAS